MRYFEKEFALEKHQQPSFIGVGGRVDQLLQNKNLGKPIAVYPEISTTSIPEITQAITEHITTAPKSYSSVTAYCNALKSFFVQTPRKVSIVPFGEQEEVSPEQTSLDTSTPGRPVGKQQDNQTTPSAEPPAGKAIFEEEPIFELPINQILDEVANRYLRSRLLDILLDSLQAEHAARFLAMDNSTNNAEKYLERLTLEYNKSRQALITREVAELSAGFGSE